MELKSRILVTGSEGMVGGALVRALQQQGYQNILAPKWAELELCDADAVNDYFAEHRPEYMFMIAARVASIAVQLAQPVDFIADNSRMTINVMEACHRYGMKKGLFLGSAVVYPDQCPQPIKEEFLMDGPLSSANESYALSKILGIRLAQGYWKQHKMRVILPMACNLYGDGDNFEPQRAHVIAALVKRFVDAANTGAEEVAVWGSGNARRQFLNESDLADAMIFLMNNYDSPEIINIGPEEDISIRDLTKKIATLAGYTGRISYDTSKPDGPARRQLDVSKMKSLGFSPRINLDEGLRQMIEKYKTLPDARKST